MKKVLYGISLFILAFGAITVNAQNIIDAEDDNNLSNFYQRTIAATKQAMPYPSLRESDVIWETCLWRTIDFREKFNQFFYFPKGEDTLANNQNRVNLAYLLYKSVRNGDFEVFEDDELKIPLDWDMVYKKTNRERHETVGYEEDEYGEVIDEGHDTIIPVTFTSDNYYKIHLKEFWYIDKQDTRMKVRIIGLALIDENLKEDAETGETSADPQVRFWVPMNAMNVRNVLARNNAYDMYNNRMERSYDEIFISRYFDSFVWRETNVYNREIHDYLTGEDAMLEATAIEERIFDIESDMWEF